jgi:hypothetical protein
VQPKRKAYFHLPRDISSTLHCRYHDDSCPRLVNVEAQHNTASTSSPDSLFFEPPLQSQHGISPRYISTHPPSSRLSRLTESSNLSHPNLASLTPASVLCPSLPAIIKQSQYRRISASSTSNHSLSFALSPSTRPFYFTQEKETEYSTGRRGSNHGGPSTV